MNHALTFIQNHLFLFGAWVLCLLTILVIELKTRRSAAPKLSPHQVVELINTSDVKLIDIRKPEQFKTAHILNSKNIPWNPQDETSFTRLKQDKLVLVCDQGQSASQLAAKLQKNGMQDVSVLAGGITAWKQINLPLVKGK